MTETPYPLRNGKYIEDPRLAEKMRYIVSRHPELRPGNETGYTWDEAGLADLFSECYKSDTRYCAEAKSWYTYHDGAWRRDVGSLYVAENIKEFARLMDLYCGEITDEDTRKKYYAFINRLGDRRFRERLMKDAASVFPIPAEQFDADLYLINCLNGTYDLKNMVFREHDWHDYLTMQTNFEYTVQSVHCLRWERFVDEVTCGDKDKADYLQRALGYSILGSSKEACMFILHGKSTRNGKSTLLGAIQHLLGDYATVSPVSIICKSDRARAADAASPTIAALKGKRFVTMSESNQYGRLDEEAIKTLTGGEKISARNLYEHQMTFLPQFTLWLSCNDLPSVRDESLFASDRIKVIEFLRHFSESERDTSLADTFRQPDSMRGIFTWLVEGYFKYLRFGLSMPEPMKQVIRKYAADNDIVLQFLEEKCTKSDDSGTLAKNLYAVYKTWCTTNGYYVMSAKKFTSGIEMHPEYHNGRVKRDGLSFFRGLVFRS